MHGCRHNEASQSYHSASCMVPIEVVLVAKATILTIGFGVLVAEATVTGVDSNYLVIGPSAPAAPMAKPPVLVICLKNFRCYPKHLKIFYLKCFIYKIFYFKTIINNKLISLQAL